MPRAADTHPVYRHDHQSNIDGVYMTRAADTHPVYRHDHQSNIDGVYMTRAADTHPVYRRRCRARSAMRRIGRLGRARRRCRARSAMRRIGRLGRARRRCRARSAMRRIGQPGDDRVGTTREGTGQIKHSPATTGSARPGKEPGKSSTARRRPGRHDPGRNRLGPLRGPHRHRAQAGLPGSSSGRYAARIVTGLRLDCPAPPRAATRPASSPGSADSWPP